MGKKSLRVLSKQELAKDIEIGMRMPSFKVLNQADARPWHFQKLLKSRGCWRLVVFAGDIRSPQQKARIEKLGRELGRDKSFLRRFTPASTKYDGVIDVRRSIQRRGSRQPSSTFRPCSGRGMSGTGGTTGKIYVDDQSYHEGHGHAYQNYGVDPEKGCAVVLRPDQHVSFVTEADNYNGIDRFFSGFMVEQKQQNGSIGQEPDVLGNGAVGDGSAEKDGVEAGEEVLRGTAGL